MVRPMLLPKQVSFFNKSLQWVEAKTQSLMKAQWPKKLGKGFLYFHLAGLAFTASWKQATSLVKAQNEKMSKDKRVFVISSSMIHPYERTAAKFFASYFGFETTAHGIHRHFLELPILYHMNKMGYYVKWMDRYDLYQLSPETKGMILIGHGAQGMLGDRPILISDQLDFLIKLTCDSRDKNSGLPEKPSENLESPEKSLFKNDPAFEQGRYQGSINAKRIFSYRDWVLQSSIWFDAIQGFDYISAKSGYVRSFKDEVKSTADDLAYFDKTKLDEIRNFNFDETKWAAMSTENLKGQFYELSKKYLEIKKIATENKNNSYKIDLQNLETKFYKGFKKILSLVINKLSLSYFTETTMPKELLNYFPELKEYFNYLVSQPEIKEQEYILNQAKEYARRHKLSLGNLDRALEPYRQKQKFEIKKQYLAHKKMLITQKENLKKEVETLKTNYLNSRHTDYGATYLYSLMNDRYSNKETEAFVKKFYIEESLKKWTRSIENEKSSEKLKFVLLNFLRETMQNKQWIDVNQFNAIKAKYLTSFKNVLTNAFKNEKYSNILEINRYLELLENLNAIHPKQIYILETRINLIKILNETNPEHFQYSLLREFNVYLRIASQNMAKDEYSQLINNLMETDPQKSIHHYYRSLIWDHPERRKLKNREWPKPWEIHLASAIKPKFKFDQYGDLME